MNERDEPMKGLADYLRASASIAERDYPTAANSGTTLRRWASEVEASRQRSAVGAEPVAWMWQHPETGNTGFVEHASPKELAQWERMNGPRKIVSPLYAAPSERPAAPAQWPESEGDASYWAAEAARWRKQYIELRYGAAPAQAGVTEALGCVVHGLAHPCEACAAELPLLDALRELLEAEDAPFPPAEEGQDAQTKWADRRYRAREAARSLLAGTPPAQSDDQRQVREDSQGLGEPGRLSPDMVAAARAVLADFDGFWRVRPKTIEKLRDALGAHPVFVAPPECEGDPGECAFNGACMYACGVQDQCPVCHVEGGQHQRGCRNAAGEQKDGGTSRG